MKTHHYLGITPQHYQEKCFEQYLRWCQNIAVAQKKDLQSVLASAAIANYYNDQFLELERSFNTVAAVLYGKVDFEIMTKNFEMIMVDIYTSYPGALLGKLPNVKMFFNCSKN